MAGSDRTVGRWFKFLLLPFVVSSALDVALAVLLGGFGHLDRDALASRVALLFEYWLVGRCIGATAPGNSRWLAAAYAIALGGLNLYLGYTTEGNTLQVLGQTAVQHLSLIEEAVKLLGMLVGVGMARRAPRLSLARLPKES